MSQAEEMPASTSISISPPASDPTSQLPDYELLLVIAKYLSCGPFDQVAEMLRNEVDRLHLMPQRIDWKGNRHNQTLEAVERVHPHITCDHLKRLCARLPQLVDSVAPPAVPGIISLLGNGRQSLLRSQTTSSHPSKPELTLINRSLAIRGISPQKMGSPNLIHFLLGREHSGKTCLSAISTQLFKKQHMHRQYLGHLAPIFCVMFDRSGDYVLTGADDHLVKIWSATDGRLLATLRGHSDVITDFSVNYENTLLATASSDKHIRIWNLKTTAPVTILSGHTQQITSVRFCPLILKDTDFRYLVSTGNDGCVCFWKWNVRTNEFESKPLKFIERPKAGCHILGSSFSTGGAFLAVGSTDHHVRAYHVDGPAGPTKILEIEAHSDQVDSLQFSNKSLRFVSGSKDGTAHIWFYEKQQWTNIPLKMSERLPNDPIVDEEKLKRIKVNMVGWNCDDTYVLTSASDYSLRVWDSKTGRLVHSLREHTDDAFVIEAHPYDPRLVLTGGHDGRIIVWDIQQGSAVNTFHNNFQGQGDGALYDVKWSRSGQTIAASDSHGHMVLIGFGNSKRHERVPNQVFFHTDYRPLVRDNNHYVIDEQTQCPPHQMPPPFLVDIDGNPHPTHFQRLVPGRENSNDDQLVPYISVNNERGVNEILQPVNREDPPVVVQENPTIDDMIQLLDNELNRINDQQENRVQQDHDYVVNNNNNNNNNNALHRNNFHGPNANQAVDRRRNSSAGNNPVRRDGDAGVRQPGANWQSRDGALSTFWMQRTVVKPLSKSDVELIYRQTEQMAQLERDFYKRESRKRPVVTQIEIKENNPKEKLTRRKMRINQQRSGVTSSSNASARMRNLVTRRTGILDYENVEDAVSVSSNDRFSGAESWTESSNSSSESESEESSEEEMFGNSSPKKGRRVAQRKRPASNDEEDEDENESDSDDNSESDEEEVVDSRPIRQKVGKKDNVHKKYEEMYNSFKEMPEQFKFPEWLSESTPKRTPYFPQIGDRVVYFKKGHQDYLKSVRLSNAYDMGQTAAQVFKKKFVKDEVFAEILDIKFEVKPPRLVTLKLGVVGADGTVSRENFCVRYHDMPNVIDFIVLQQFYNNGIQRKTYWKHGLRFKTVIDNEWYFGTVVEWIVQDTPFQCISVRYATGESDLLSPWDIEPVTESDPEVIQADDHFPLTEEDRQSLAYSPEDRDNWPECGIHEECERIIQGLDIIRELSMAEHFNTPVDLTVHPIYGMVIAYMIDLTTIYNRLTNRFYHRKEALKFDIGFIEKNAVEFNERDSPIILNARRLTALLLRFVDDVGCFDPKPIINIVKNQNWNDKHESDDADGETEPGKRCKKMTAKRSSKAMRTNSSKTWQHLCKEFLDYLFTLPDSQPFRAAVDPIEHPDYNRLVDNPMDLGTVREQLMSGIYDNLREFRKDMDLIFQNSKNYNTNKRSHIYTMTLNMASLCKERLDDIARHHKRGPVATKRSKPQTPRKKNKKPAKPPKKKQKVNRRINSSSPDLSEPGPSGLCSGTSASEAGPSTSGIKSKRMPSRRLNGVIKEEPVAKVENHSVDDPDLDRESSTEIEDNAKSDNDTDATEIEENESGQESSASRSSEEPPSKRKKSVRGCALNSKRIKVESDSDETEAEEDDASFTTRTPSRSSNGTTVSRSSASEEQDSVRRSKRVTYIGKGKCPARLNSRTRNGGVSKIRYVDDDDSGGSDYEYGPGFILNQRTSSRGRIIKFKSPRAAGEVC